MTLTKDMIARLRFAGQMDIDTGLEARLLRQFGTEPHLETHSEQDLHEQVRKYVRSYKEMQETVQMDF